MAIFRFIKEKIKKTDPGLFACTVLLSLVSIVTVIGAVTNFGKSKLIMQVAMTIVGVIATVFIANVNYKPLIDKIWVFLLGFSVLILLITAVFGSSGANMETSNRSWLEIPVIGIMVQPSEFTKITFICTFARHLYLVRDRINKPIVLLQLAIHALAVVGLILLSGDLGVAIMYLAVILILLFCAGLSVWYFAGLAAAGVIAFPFIWDKLATYQQMRILAGFDPSVDPVKYGWQALLSKQCIHNGGFFGIGLFGRGDYEELTASHTDFIFATICEKFGFVGGFAVVCVLAALVIRILVIAHRSRGDYGYFICIGVAGFLIVQTLENLGMCLAMLPVIGITLPFLSCGGSSMLATFMLVGLVHSVNSHKSRISLSL